jgi:hypothetical protein
MIVSALQNRFVWQLRLTEHWFPQDPSALWRVQRRLCPMHWLLKWDLYLRQIDRRFAFV